jgi:hypothetical protein
LIAIQVDNYRHEIVLQGVCNTCLWLGKNCEACKGTGRTITYDGQILLDFIDEHSKLAKRVAELESIVKNLTIRLSQQEMWTTPLR